MTVATLDGSILDQLHSALGHDTAVIRNIIDNYMAGMPDRLSALNNAAANDPALLERAAHALASPSATLGVRAIAEPCIALERAVENGRPSAECVAGLIERIEAAVEPAYAALRSWLERHPD